MFLISTNSLKKEKLLKAQKLKEKLEKHMYLTYIKMTEYLGNQLRHLAEHIDVFDVNDISKESIDSLNEYLKSLVSRDNSIMQSVNFFTISFTSFHSDATWLDEIAEGVKNVMRSLNTVIIRLQGVKDG
jgi:hypothetical protein